MDPKLGFDILVNGALRSRRDRKEVAYEAARYRKSIRQNELVEIVDSLYRREGDDDGRWEAGLATRLGKRNQNSKVTQPSVSV